MERAEEERWQTKIKSLREGIEHIFETGEFADVTFIVRGQTFKAHKLVLASRSLELARQLMNPNAPDEIVVPATITLNGFRIFLSFIYRNELNASDKRSVVEAYQCAKHYHQKALENKCLEVIQSWDINADDVCDLLGMEATIPALNEKCTSFLRSNGNQVISSEAFTRANEKTVFAILASAALTDVPALQCIERIMNWGKHHFDIRDADCSLVRKSLLNTNPPLLGMLGFKNLKVEELPNLVVNYPNLLTQSEISQFVMYYGTKKASDLPPWCSV